MGFDYGSSPPVREKGLSHFICRETFLAVWSGKTLMKKIMTSVLVVWPFCKRRKIWGANHNCALPSAFPVGIHKDTGMELFWCSIFPGWASWAALAQLAPSLLPFPPLTLWVRGEESSRPWEMPGPGINDEKITIFSHCKNMSKYRGTVLWQHMLCCLG